MIHNGDFRYPTENETKTCKYIQYKINIVAIRNPE